MQQLEYIEKYSLPGEHPEAVVIWLHVLGADYNDFVPLVPELNLSKCVKFIFPNAPMRPITINNGYVMRGWYDIYDLSTNIDTTTDFSGIEQSVAAINNLIQSQMAHGVNSEKIILAGFSQGGVLSYTAGLLSEKPLGGIIALSCYLPGVDKIIANGAGNKQVPIFAAHGLHDPIVPYTGGIGAYQKLKQAGFNIQWHEYPMEHSLYNEEISDLANWFNTVS